MISGKSEQTDAEKICPSAASHFPHPKAYRLCALLVFFIALFYWHTLSYPFLPFWDDASYVTENPMIALTPENFFYFLLHTKHSLYTPVTMWSFMADYAVSHDPFVFRMHNLSAHCVAAVFFFLILLKLGIRRTPAFFFALFWAIHPQKIESVCWISERKDVLCGMFAMASCYVFLSAMLRRQRHPFLLSIFAGMLCLLSVFSKPASLTLPGLFAVWLISGHFSKRKCRIALPAILIGGFAVIWSFWMTSSVNPPSLIDDWTLPAHNLLWYFSSVIALDFSPIHPYRINPVIASSHQLHFLIFTGFLFCLSRIGWRKMSCWIFAFLILSVPVLGLHKSTFFEWCDRYNYLLSAVTIGMLASLCRPIRIGRYFPGKFGRHLPKILFAILYGMVILISFAYSFDWAQEDKIFRRAVTKNESKGIPHAKAVEMLMTTAILTGNAEDLATVSACLERYADVYTPRFADYMRIWEHMDGVTRESITFARDFGKVHECVLRGGTVSVAAWDALAGAYPAGVPVFCENFLIPAFLNDLLQSDAIAAFDLMMTKINTEAVDSKLLELRNSR